LKLILDTGIIISALIKEFSANRNLLIMPVFDFYLPEYALDEINKHKEKISRLSGLSQDVLSVMVSVLVERITIVPETLIKPRIKEASKLIGFRDKNDVPFVALALAIENDGIWSNDKDFAVLSDIKIWTTKDLLHYISA
jgi:predicted nucleic acid-binding protein